MRFAVVVLAFISVANAAPACNHNVTLSSPQWLWPSTLQQPRSICTFSFTVPAGAYASLTVSATGLSTTDAVKISDTMYDGYNYNHIYQTCGTDCDPLNATVVWPTNFAVTVYTGAVTTMKLQMTVTLKAFNPSVNVVEQISTDTDSAAFVLYFEDFKPGTSYQITSKNSQINLQAPLVWKPHENQTELNNVFVLDGGKVIGTLCHVEVLGFISNSSKVVLYVADRISIRGAVMINDQSNIKPLYRYAAFYAPVYSLHQTDYATVRGGADPPQDGAVTFIGDKDGSTPITISDVDNMGFGGNFSFMAGGPIVSHQNLVAPLTFSMMPKTLSGNVNTVYINQYPGSIEYKTTGN